MRDIICARSEHALTWLPDNSVDLVVTDPPFGWGFMGKDWDKAVPSVAIWWECLRALKPGGFAFVISGPRMDCLSEMGKRLAEAGFETGFTPLFWTYASGFPKAANMSKLVDKRLGAEREVVGETVYGDGKGRPAQWSAEGSHEGWKRPAHENYNGPRTITTPATLEAIALDGSYAGFQPKPAVEVVIVAMKPLEHGTYIDQALDNGHGVTWLDDGRIPVAQGEEGYVIKTWDDGSKPFGDGAGHPYTSRTESSGRFPANLLVSDDVLNDGRVTKSSSGYRSKGGYYADSETFHNDEKYRIEGYQTAGGDSGSFSRYFSLDAWWAKRQAELRAALPWYRRLWMRMRDYLARRFGEVLVVREARQLDTWDTSGLPESVQRTFPFLIVPKAAKKEKNLGCEGLPVGDMKTMGNYGDQSKHVCSDGVKRTKGTGISKQRNTHPTVKPLKLMSYLVTLGSRPGDLVVDPFAGTCTTGMAAKLLVRDWLMIEQEEQWCQIGQRRIEAIEGESL